MTAYTISSGVVSSGLTLSAADTATVLAGGKTVSTTDFGLETVLSGGIADITTVSKGGELVISSGAVASGLVVEKGGVVSRGGTIEGSGVDYGVISGAVLAGAITVSSGGETQNVTIAKGGVETVNSLGLAALATIAGGGELIDNAVARHTVIDAGGLLTGSGKLTMNTLDYGLIEGVTVLGDLKVSAGGVVSGATVAIVAATSKTSAVIGAVVVSQGGEAAGLTVSSGASLTVLSHGVANNTVAIAGATIVDDGTMAFNTPGAAIPFSGNLSGSGTIVAAVSGGALEIGGTTSGFTGVLDLSVGTASLATSQGIGGGEIVWTATSAAPATLKLNAADLPAPGATYATALTNFDVVGDGLYMASLAYSSGATAAVSGTILAVTDGGKVYDFKLAGDASTAYNVVSGPLGGTLVKAVGGTTVALTHAMAAFGAPTAAVTAAASGGLGDHMTTVVLGGSATGSGWRAT
jgi:autotransporter passenger strand-loop-strand repeat protein